MAAGYVAEAPEPASFAAGRKVLLVPEPGASQSALYVARPAPGLDEAQRGESVAVSRLLGGDFTSRLNSVIREEKGYSYGVDSYLLDVVRKRLGAGRGDNGRARHHRRRRSPKSSRASTAWRRSPSPPRRSTAPSPLYRQTLAGEAETSAGLFGDLLSAVGTGSTLEQNHAWREDRTRLTRHDVAGPGGGALRARPGADRRRRRP